MPTRDTIPSISCLSDQLQGELRFNESLSRYTTWRIGGPAQVFICPKDLNDICATINFVREKQIPLFVLGRGSNLLIDDEGLPGITLYMAKTLRDMQVSDSTIQAGGGVSLPTLAKKVSAQEYTGFEFLFGIPGTVGAGVLINAGAGGSQIKDILKSVTFLDRHGQLHTWTVNQLDLQYRHSALLHQPVIVVEASFRLTHKEEPAIIRQRQRDIINKRRQKFPLTQPNAGSVFKRPENGAGPFAGWLIETAGMKGYRIGDAQVSEQHANFIVNLGRATAEDVKKLIDKIITRVLRIHNITLEREIIYWPEQNSWDTASPSGNDIAKSC